MQQEMSSTGPFDYYCDGNSDYDWDLDLDLDWDSDWDYDYVTVVELKDL